MKRTNRARRLRPAVLPAALLLVLVLVTARGEASAGGTQYIVKYKERAPEDPPFAVVDRAEMKRLRDADALEWYEPDGEAELIDPVQELTLFAADGGDDTPWHLEMIGADSARERGCLGTGVRVGVVDSGVSPHPDLRDCLAEGHNYIENARDPGETSDSYGHGTRVAGLVAGAGEGSCSGPAPGAQIVPLKVTDGKSVRVSAVCRAIYGGVDDYGCRVLNLSLGLLTHYEALQEAVEYAESKGVTVVSVTGNGGGTDLYYPAAYETVIGVGAVDRTGNLYTRSNRNESAWLAAPGVEVTAPSRDGGYQSSTGTSFAAPLVSGAAAVLLSADPSLRPAELRALLAETAADRGAEGWDPAYGWGVPDLGAALEALGGRTGEPDLRFVPETGPARALSNETGQDISCRYYLAYYDEDGTCLEVASRDLTVPAGGTASLDGPEPGRTWAQFVCDPDTLAPLLPERRPS